MGKVHLRIGTILFACMILLCVLPVGTLAADDIAMEGSVSSTALAASLPPAQDGVITLVEDLKMNTGIVLSSGPDIRLDLAGHELRYVGSYDNNIFIEVEKGSLTICDSVGGGSVVVDETNYSYVNNTVSLVQVWSNATFTLESGTIQNSFLADEATPVYYKLWYC